MRLNYQFNDFLPKKSKKPAIFDSRQRIKFNYSDDSSTQPQTHLIS